MQLVNESRKQQTAANKRTVKSCMAAKSSHSAPWRPARNQAAAASKATI
jgi:hypothetical protein